MKISFFQHNSIFLLRWTFSLTPEEAMVYDLAKACGIEKIIVMFSENPDLVSNIYRFKKHFSTHYPIYDYANTIGHPICTDNFSIMGRGSNNIARTIKEAMYIRVNDPSLNSNIVKFNLTHIWDEVLINTPNLKLKQTLPHLLGIHYTWPKTYHGEQWAQTASVHVNISHLWVVMWSCISN